LLSLRGAAGVGLHECSDWVTAVLLDAVKIVRLVIKCNLCSGCAVLPSQ